MIRPQAQRGLTLVELLLGLAIAAVLMMPLADLFRSASGNAVTARAALDLNADARFALDRIAQRAVLLPATSSGAAVTDAGAAAWLAPLGYAVVNGNLVESGTVPGAAPAPGPGTGATRIVAANVSAFRLSAPEVGDGQPMLKIDLTLAAEGSSVSASRIVRVGVPF